MQKVKKLFAVLMSVIMVLSALPFSTATAATIETPDWDDGTHTTWHAVTLLDVPLEVTISTDVLLDTVGSVVTGLLGSTVGGTLMLAVKTLLGSTGDISVLDNYAGLRYILKHAKSGDTIDMSSLFDNPTSLLRNALGTSLQENVGGLLDLLSGTVGATDMLLDALLTFALNGTGLSAVLGAADDYVLGGKGLNLNLPSGVGTDLVMIGSVTQGDLSLDLSDVASLNVVEDLPLTIRTSVRFTGADEITFTADGGTLLGLNGESVFRAFRIIGGDPENNEQTYVDFDGASVIGNTNGGILDTGLDLDPLVDLDLDSLDVDLLGMLEEKGLTYGSGIETTGGAVTIANVNLATCINQSGGAILAHGPLNVINSTIASNYAETGGGIYTSDLPALTADADVTFARNKSAIPAQWLLDDPSMSDSRAIYVSNILTATHTKMTGSDNAYNNYDINFDASESPTINAAAEGQTSVTGTGVNGAVISVTVVTDGTPGTTVTTTVSGGTWSVSVPALAAGAVINAVQSEPGQAPSISATTIAAEKQLSATPRIDPVSIGAASVSGTGMAGATIALSFIDAPSNTVISLGTTTVSPGGTWTISGISEVPVGPDKFSAVQTEPEKKDSAPATVTVALPQLTPAPVITVGTEGDNVISGTGIPGATITVTVPTSGTGSPAGTTAEPLTTTVDAQGDWSVSLSGDRKLLYPGRIAARQDQDGPENEPMRTGYAWSPSVRTSVGILPMPQSAVPIVTQPKYGDTAVSGTNGVLGATVTVTIDGTSYTSAPVGSNGEWSVIVPQLTTPGTKIDVSQVESGKKASPTVSVEVPAQPKSAYPSVNSVSAADEELTGSGVPGAEITITNTNGDIMLGTVTVDGDGKWVLPLNPGDISDGDELTISQEEEGKTAAELNVITRPRTQSVPPTIDTPVEVGGAAITGTGVPGATINIYVDDYPLEAGERVPAYTATVAPNGTWSVDAPSPPIQEGQVLYVAQDEDGLGDSLAESFPVTTVVVLSSASVLPPSVNIPVEFDTHIRGKGTVGATVTVVWKLNPLNPKYEFGVTESKTLSATVDAQGNWEIPVVEETGIELKDGDTITVSQNVGGTESAALTDILVQEASTSDPPTINPVTVGDAQITGTYELHPYASGDNYDPTIEVTIDGLGSFSSADGEIELDGAGNWSLAVNPEDLVADMLISAIQSELTLTGEAGVLAPSYPVETRVAPAVLSAMPAFYPQPAAGDLVLSGTGVTDAEITITVNGGDPITTTVGPDATWSVLVPELDEGDIIVITQKEANKDASPPLDVTVAEMPQSDPPTIDDLPILEHTTAVTGTNDVGAEVTVILNPTIDADTGEITGGEELDVTVTGNKWSVDFDSPLEPDSIIAVIQQIPGRTKPSEAAVARVEPLPESAVPEIEQPIYATATTISGTGEVGATVSVTINGGMPIQSSPIDTDGKWSVTVPALSAGDEISVTQDEGADKNPSDPVTATVMAQEQSLSPSIHSLSTVSTQITGTAAPNATVTVKIGSNPVVSVTADGSGNWTVPLDPPLPAGTVISATQKDGDKTESNAATVTVQKAPAAPTPPRIVSAASTTVEEGMTGSFHVIATGTAPFSYSLENAPAGVSINASTGIITVADNVTQDKYTFTINVSNASGTPAAQEFTLNVAAPPNITSADNANIGRGGTFQVETDSLIPVTYRLDGAPLGIVRINPETGIITVAEDADAGQTYAFDIIASNGLSPDAVQAFTLTTTADIVSALPNVDPIAVGDTKISGKGQPGATVIVTLPDGSDISAVVDENGNWSVAAEPPIINGDTVIVSQQEDGKNQSADVTIKVNDSVSTRPTVDSISNGDMSISGTGEPGSKITVTLPDGKKVTVTVSGNGVWTATVSSPLKSDDILHISQTEPGKNPSAEVDIIVSASGPVTPPVLPDVSTKPIVNPLEEGDTEISGKAKPHDTVTVILPDGSEVETSADDDGNWSVTVAPPLENGDTIIVTAKEDGKQPSPSVTVTIGVATLAPPSPVLASVLETEDHLVYIRGYKDGTIHPNGFITRAEVAMIFWRLTKAPEKNDTAPGAFPDVRDGAWYSQAVNYLAQTGILNGYKDGTFKPNQGITRAEFVTIATRFDSMLEGIVNPFTDVPATHWAYEAIVSALMKGWINGYKSGAFRPNNRLTRAEAVTIVDRMLGRGIERPDVPEELYSTWPDLNPEFWAFTAMIEASVSHDYERKDNGYELWTDTE